MIVVLYKYVEYCFIFCKLCDFFGYIIWVLFVFIEENIYNGLL